MEKKYFLLTIAAYLLLNACNKDDMSAVMPSCKKVLKGWDIYSVNYPEGFPAQRAIFFPWGILQYYSLGTNVNRNALTKARLESIYFINESMGYVGGQGELSTLDPDTNTDAVFLSTVDGGYNWNKRYLEDVREINDIVFFDVDNGIGLFSFEDTDIHSKLKLVRTENGGKNWNTIDLPVAKIKSYKFINTESKVMIYGIDTNENAVLFTSKDKGLNWSTHNFPEEHCNKIYFINDNSGFASCGVLLFPENIYRTNDGGKTWQSANNVPLNVSSLIHFNSENEGFIINPVIEYIEHGWEVFPELKSYDIFRTADKGLTWGKNGIDKACNLMGNSYSPSKNIFYSFGATSNRFKLK